MCGIIFYSGRNHLNIDESTLNVIKHRGPDNASIEHFESKNHKITLGHRRLSIIDLQNNSNQPMQCFESNKWITFNGEVYNYLDIKSTLEKYNYKFRTNSDTEVLLKAYDKWGADCLNYLNGMFSFSIWDDKNKILFAARDRYGIKPMYYWNSKNNFIIASEIKQITSLRDYSRKFNPEAISQFIEYGNFSYDETTMWKDIYEIEPGNSITIDFNDWTRGQEIKKKKWYVPNFNHTSYKKKNDSILIDEFKHLFMQAIKRRMQADVSVGALLSGGLDSSSIVSYINKYNLNKSDFKTFSLIYDNEDYSEKIYIDEVNRKLELNSKVITYDLENYKKDLDSVIWHNDLPTVGRSILSHYNIYQNINSDKYKVIIEGQGADEYMAGYGNFHIAYLISLLTKKNLFRFANEYRYFTKTRKGTYLSDFKMLIEYGYPNIYKKFKRTKSENHLSKFKTKTSKNERSNIELNQIFKARFKILRSILHSVDRLSMSNSVETRVPFLDHELVEFVTKLPFHMKISNGERKYILRESVKNIVPQKIYNRKDKMGFSSPEQTWLANEMKDFFLKEVQNTSKLPFIDSEKINFNTRLFLSKKAKLNNGIIRAINVNRWINKFKISI